MNDSRDPTDPWVSSTTYSHWPLAHCDEVCTVTDTFLTDDLLCGAVSSDRPHARQPFGITKGTAVIATKRYILSNSARALSLMLAGA